MREQLASQGEWSEYELAKADPESVLPVLRIGDSSPLASFLSWSAEWIRPRSKPAMLLSRAAFLFLKKLGACQ